jgi:hypothetical protein
MRIISKLPGKQQTAQVFAVISILLYGWTTYRFIQKLPSWLYYLNAAEIISNYSFTLVLNFLEALLFMSLVVAIGFLLPRGFFAERFVAHGSLLAVFSLGYLIYLAGAIGQSKSSQFPSELFSWTPFVFLISFVLAIVLPFLKPVRKVIDELADRAVVFLYILLPVTGLGLLIFLFENLF